MLLLLAALITFTPPKDWKALEDKQGHVSFVTPELKQIRPSINLVTEPYTGTLDDYVLAVQKVHESNKKNTYTTLGSLETSAGLAHISQIDTKNGFITMRTLQCILTKNGKAMIITATAPLPSYDAYHNTFLTAFRTLTFDEKEK